MTWSLPDAWWRWVVLVGGVLGLVLGAAFTLLPAAVALTVLGTAAAPVFLVLGSYGALKSGRVELERETQQHRRREHELQVAIQTERKQRLEDHVDCVDRNDCPRWRPDWPVNPRGDYPVDLSVIKINESMAWYIHPMDGS